MKKIVNFYKVTFNIENNKIKYGELLPPLNENSLEVGASWVKQTSVY